MAGVLAHTKADPFVLEVLVHALVQQGVEHHKRVSTVHVTDVMACSSALGHNVEFVVEEALTMGLLLKMISGAVD